MSKGLTPIVIAILMTLIVVFIGGSVFYWMGGVGETFQNMTEETTNTEMRETKTDIGIVHVAGNQIGLKNKGESVIPADELNFYLNGTRYNHLVEEPAGRTEMYTSDLFIINITSLPPGTNNYTVRVSGPYGASDEVFAEMSP